MSILEELASVHSEFGLYPRLLSDRYSQIPPEYNIVERLRGIAAGKPIASVYDKYITHYRTHAKGGQPLNVFAAGGVAKNVDLFSIGDSVLDNGQACLMFVFLGSLSDHEKLSVNVLSCLWALDCFNTRVDRLSLKSRSLELMPTEFQEIAKNFWPQTHKFTMMMNSLRITPDVARRSYVVDAVRVPYREGKRRGKRNSKACQELLKREVDILRPRFIIAVGKKAYDYLEYLEKAVPKRFTDPVPTVRPVNFPRYTINKLDRPNVERKWDSLRELYDHCLAD